MGTGCRSYFPLSPGPLCGTDNFGRDIFSRILKGSQVVFFVGAFAVALGLTAGFLLGAVAGYFGGAADEIIMRLMDAKMAFPGVILALVLIAIFGTGLINTALALGIMSIPRFCRITRAGFMQIKEMDYIKAARARGVSPFRLIFRHILPNITSSLVVTATLGFSGAVLSEAGLSYLGLGIQPPDTSWGKMLYEAQSFLLTQPWYAFIPGIMITLMVLGFNLLGDGLRDITDNTQ
ncbi:ABC transporter permease [Lachnospiraceae bacterium 54-53]